MLAMLKYVPGVLTKKISMQELRPLLNAEVAPYITKLSVHKIHKIINGFGEAAVLAVRAGFDMVQIHGDRMCGSFSSSVFNHRTDEYGGSLENRYRFAAEIVRAIKRACGDDFPVSIRYSVESKTKGLRQGALPGEQFVEAGRDMAESIEAARYLADAGCDMFNCDNGTYDAWYWAHPPIYMPKNCNLDDVAELRRHIDVPVVCAGARRRRRGHRRETYRRRRLRSTVLGRSCLGVEA